MEQLIPQARLTRPTGDDFTPRDTPETSLGERSLREDDTDVQEPLLALPPQPHTTHVPITRRPVPSRDSGVHYSVLPAADTSKLPETEVVTCLSSTSSRTPYVTPPDRSLWMPLALRWPWMLSIIIYGVALLVIVVVFHSISSESEGAMDDTRSSAAYFAWHFLPTLLAVTYVIMLMIVQDGVKRTEGLARLANERGSSASATILRVPGTWWIALADSFPRKSNGFRFSPAMFSAILAYILGFLVISPFSSALLSSKDMMISSNTTMLRTQAAPGQTLQPRLSTPEFYASIGHTFQNVDSSPWITDNYTVLPFWPAHIERPSGSRFDAADGDWTAETSVYQTELLCEDLKLESGPNFVNYTYEPGRILGTGYINMTSLKLASESGCEYGVSYATGDFGSLGRNLFYWSNVTGVNVHHLWGSYEPPIKFDDFMLNHTEQCEAADLFLTVVNLPFNESYEVGGKLCRSKFFQARLPVTVSLSAGATTFQFDRDDFQKSRIATDNSNVNITAFHEAFFSSSWDDYLRTSISSTKRPYLGGPANLLAAGYDFKVPGLLKDPDFVAKAAKIKQYTFGLALQAAIQNVTAVTEVEGEIRTRRRRVVVSGAVAIILEAVLGLATFLLLIAFWSSRFQRRPLGLSQDIGIPNTVAALITAQSKSSPDLRGISSMSVLDAKQALASYSYTIDHGNLRMTTSTSSDLMTPSRQAARTRNQDRIKWEPIVLSSWAILALIFLLTALLITIAVLYWYSRGHGLYQSGFVYQAALNIGDISLGYIAPYSIIPTLLAVVIGLWWDAIEVHFRTAQPYISMAKGPITARKGSALTYQSSYLAWAGFRAVKRQHWLLAFVSTGAFLSQILAISMSALWQREPVQLESLVEVSQPFQVRDVPFVYDKASYGKTQSYKGNILGTVFQSLQTNWMYSASLQISMNASQPSWSSEGWSFVPVSIPASSWETRQNSNSSSDEPQARRAVATVRTPAIRGRLECSTIAKDLEDRFWLTEVNLTKKGYFNETLRPRPWKIGYQLGCSFSDPEINFSPNMTANFTDVGGYGNCSSDGGTTKILTAGIPTCCAQESEHQPDQASIGQWSPVDITLYPEGSKYASQTDNFTVKWIYGPAPVEYTMSSNIYPLLIWPEPPRLAMLNCAPFVESAEATVTVDLESGSIQKYSILNEPIRHVEAFSDDFVARAYNDSSSFNVSASFGTIFVAALLGAAQLKYITGCSQDVLGACLEDSSDRTFSYRAPGLNLDYMSYSMLKMAGDDQASMLNHKKLEELAQVTFTTYFQHYASQNVSLDGSGGRAFQRPNETIAADMGPPASQFDPTKVAPSRVKVAASPSIMATVSQPVEMLRMSSIAVWLCIIILAWLIITTVAILVLKSRYFSPLLGGVETIADVP
ncbi:hypothetical protein VTL71DRAFT_7162 [Oculimacula yallundae]|uniref:Uncharacterized protein n=1 Tax=Oculimacula yallundae TaxID=86028 RepID=A0ABR4BVX5_9HELO